MHVECKSSFSSAEVIALVVLKPVGNQATFLELLHGIVVDTLVLGKGLC